MPYDKAGLEAVLCSPDGVILKRSTKFSKVNSVPDAKLLAVELGVNLAIQDNIHVAVIFSYSSMVVNSLMERKRPPFGASMATFGLFWIS